MVRQLRIDGIDFWRGLVLCMIFINHVPGNRLEMLTSRNFGWSDASEAFVFLSGVSVALAYGRQFMAGSLLAGAWRLTRRAGVLYGVQIGLSFAAVGIFALGYLVFDDDGLLSSHGRDLFVQDPKLASFAVLTLGHQLGYFNILPLYIVLMLLAVVILLLARLDVRLMLAASIALYSLARLAEVSLPTWPDGGTWFFNPFAWQLLFAIGLALGLALYAGRPAAAEGNEIVDGLALGVLLVSAVVVSNGFGLAPGLADAAWARLDLTKADLGLVRLLHFLALAYVVYRLRLPEKLRPTFLWAALCLLGRQGLAVFATGSLLAALGQVIYARMPETSWTLDALLIGGGLFVHLFVAWACEHAVWRLRRAVA